MPNIVIKKCEKGQWTMDNGHHTMSVDISDLNAGVYFVKIKTNDNEVVSRIVKQ